MSESLEAPEQDQDQPEPSDSEASEASAFDPSSLPDEAREYLSSREKELQATMTRKTQEAAETRRQAEQVIEALSDPDHPQHKQVLGYFNLEVEEDDEDDDDLLGDDPTEDLRRELEELKQLYSQDVQTREQQQQEDQIEGQVAEQIEELQDKEGREFTDKELELLFSYAVSNPSNDGNPDVQGAFDALTGAYSTYQKDWINRKKAPRPPGQGTPASRDFDIRDRKARISRSQEIAEALMSQSSD